jgi:integrase
VREQARQRALIMLSALLDSGLTYREVGRDFGVGHSTVERHVKALVSLVAFSTPIAGVPQVDMASLGQLRMHAREVMAAVRSAMMADQTVPPAELDETQLLAGMRRIRRLSDNPTRDIALLLTLLCTGAKPLEIARLQVEDYLCADGTVRRQSRLKAGTAIPGRERVIFFESERACDAVDAYLQERVRRRMGVWPDGTYRGLDPASALFLTGRGLPFKVRTRGRDDPRPTCPLLLTTFAGIFRRAGWGGLTTQHARRLFAQRLAGKGADMEQLGALLGLASDRSVKRLLERRPRPLSELVKDLA